MYSLFLVLHFVACLMLIMLVLMQSGKGSQAGIFGSANSDSVFAGPSAATFITKFTAGVAAFIMFTSIFLTINSSKRGMSSVVDNVNIPPSTPVSAPVAPASK
ncbi:MAG: preprotein translocase subunit SecG [Elusimicrobiota bacterium]|jgi:preprotein translocase subunit SecG|nr:preprotein translocase subunit SecG [Elusimicrobiota bacterium]